MTRDYPVFPSKLFISTDYSGDQQSANKYLGIDNSITLKPTVKLSVHFETPEEIAAFFTWWHDYTDDGTLTFLVVATLFGKASTYGVRAISSVGHKETAIDANKVTFSAEIMFDSDTVDNEIPTATAMTIYVEENSSDNFVVLSGLDVEGNALEYAVIDIDSYGRTQDGEGFGILTGTPPNLLYTPDPSFAGTDTFQFTVSDVFNTSDPATVTIEVGEVAKTDAEFQYTITDPIVVNGNYHYMFADDILRRGNGSYLVPPAIYNDDTFIGRNSSATYIDSNLLKYALSDIERIEDDVRLYEDESTNVILESEFMDTLESVFSKSNMNATNTGYATGPDGTTNASKLEVLYTASASSHYITASNDYSMTEYLTYTLSIFAKADEIEFMEFQLRDADNNIEYGAFFGLTDGAVYGKQNIDSTTVQDIGNGWYRFAVTFTALESSILAKGKLLLADSSDNTSFTGTTNDGLLVFGMQLEQGELSSYIPTTDTAITRAKDVIRHPLTIWSDDHIIDERTNVVETCNVINWGDRLDYTNFFKGQTLVTSFTVANAIGVCQGTIFNGMFWGFPLFVPAFDTSNGVWFQDMFRECEAGATPLFDLSNGLYFQRMYKDSEIGYVQDLDTVKGQYFQEMFMGSDISCMGGLDTTNKINTTAMFIDTPNLTDPDGIPSIAEQTALLAGDDWTNTGDACIMVLNITEDTAGTCDVSTLTGTCTATSTHTIEHTAASAPDFEWTLTGCTLASGSLITDETISVESVIGKTRNITLSCAVTDINGTVDSGDYIFTHTVVPTYPVIDLDKAYALINLENIIDDAGYGSEPEILITNSRINCAVTTGNLGTANVEFWNTGNIQAFSRADGVVTGDSEKAAFTATSDITLTNHGSIQGCGGRGGDGGDGKDTSGSTTSSEVRCGGYDDDSVVWRQCYNLTKVEWNGIVVHFGGNVSGPFTVGGVSGLYRDRYNYEHAGPSATCDANASNTDPVYCIKHTYTSYYDISGGDGGEGGQGQGYNLDTTLMLGEDGDTSSPSGGYSGGDGGDGGVWGDDGEDGEDGGGTTGTGDNGLSAGKAIIGTSYFTSRSVIGTTNGGVSS